MTVIDVKVPALHAGQREIIDSSARYKVLACGRRWGKTTLAIRTLAGASVKTSKPYAYFAPTYKMLKEVWREMRRTLRSVTKVHSESEHRIETLTGGVIECWSLHDPDGPRGRKYAGVVVDEAARIRNGSEVWAFVLRPLLADFGGWSLFLSTPAGRNHFWDWYRTGIDPLYEDWQSWNYDSYSNPHIAPSEIDAARAEMPDRVFRQEFLAEFLEGEGAVFRRVAECATAEPVQPYRGEFIAGVDWGQVDDFTAIVVLDRHTGRMVDIDRFNEIGWSLQRKRISAMHQKWDLSRIVCEINSIGSPNFEALQIEGLPVASFTTTATSKPPLIESLVLAFERGEISIFDDPVLVSELEAYERKVNSVTGRSTYSAPDNLHDDTVMALALAWHGITMPVPGIL
ncbi:hypothetical protein GF380_03235 [Candidatus Uhrbacteria bacterium]|nr:hypothetical protein [Candidatus Uhrbacteria bacterium]